MQLFRVLLTPSVLILSLLISVLAFAADNKTANKPPASATRGLTEFAASKGVKTCLKRMEQVNNFVVSNNRAGAYIFLPPSNANQSITSTSLEVYSASKANAAPFYASTSVVPTSANDCGIVYDTVSYRAQSCDQVKKTEFAKYSFSGMLAKNVQIVTRDEKQPNKRTFLMPAGTGCVVINKEAVFIR
jgi:hypothetical protein